MKKEWTKTKLKKSKPKKGSWKQALKLQVLGRERGCGCHCTLQQDRAIRHRHGEKRVGRWGYVWLINKGEGERKTRFIFSCFYHKSKWAMVFTALMELALRQTGADGFTCFSVRRPYEVRMATLDTKALEDLIWLWLLLLEQITALCSSCMRHMGQTWHSWHWDSSVEPACACSQLSSQLAEYLLWDPAGEQPSPAEGNIWTIAVNRCPHHPRLHQVSAIFQHVALDSPPWDLYL